MSWFTVKTRSFTGGWPRHKIKLPDHARVHTESWPPLGDAIISCITLLSRSAEKRVNVLLYSSTYLTRCYFLRSVWWCDATQRDGLAVPARFISRTRDYRDWVRCVERVTNSVRRARHRLKYLCRKHRNLVNGPASYESRFICAFANIVSGHRRTWRTKNVNVRIY